MKFPTWRAGLFCSLRVISFVLLLPTLAGAQTPSQVLPELVVTAERVPASLDRIGSAISVIDSGTLQSTNPSSVLDALRSVPGVDISESGGPAATANVRIRGANTGQTLVMIDGIRVNDPSNASGDFDFSMLAPAAIERIEVLRGPQSALYGSDAIGGVINIITRKGQGPAKTTATLEAGSYGSVFGSGAVTGSKDHWSYAFTGNLQRSDGFSRYGYRIPAIEARFPHLESDGFHRAAGSARVGYDAGDGVRFDANAITSYTKAGFDAATGAFPDTPSVATRWFSQINAKLGVDTLDGRLVHSLSAFANRNDRAFDETSYRINMSPANTTRVISDFIGDRTGAEYQGTAKLGNLGTLVFGSKAEHETADTFATNILPSAGPRRSTLAATQDTRALFSLWQLPIGKRFNVSVGGRLDEVVGVARFATWRTTASYVLAETGTKFRGSAGTGAKAPTLFQLYAPIYGNAGLDPEQSLGYDFGIDQSFWNGRVNLSATRFHNDLQNLIEFDAGTMKYFNVARARTEGVEVGADVELVPSYLRAKLAYTNMRATDLRTGLDLARRPEHSGRLALALTPLPQWLIEPRIIWLSKRFSSANETGLLSAYTRLDLYTQYQLSDSYRVFARGENIFNERYQDVLNYGTTGPAIYAGVSGAW